MKIAFIDKTGSKISVNKKSLIIDNQKIPLRLLDAVVVGTACSLESKDIIKMSVEGVALLLISARSNEMAILASANSKNAELKLEQYNAQSKALSLAQYFISEKIKRHSYQLLKHNRVLDIEKVLQKVDKVKRVQTLLGVEGSFSKRYFTHYFKLLPKKFHLGKRSKNPPLDPVNAILSFFYMVVYNLITVRLLAYGFEPSIGFLHQPFRTHNALASDLMELFRADINEFVLELFKKDKLDSSDFSKQNGVYLKYSGRRKIWGDFQKFNQNLQKDIDKEIKILRHMIKG